MTNDEKLMQQALLALLSLVNYENKREPLTEREVKGERAIDALFDRLARGDAK